MDLSLREKRIWIKLLSQLVVYGIYYAQLLRNRLTPIDLLFAVIAVIVLQIVLQIVLAITARRDARLNIKDERDLIIDRSAYRNAYMILVGLLIAAIALTAIRALEPNLRDTFHPGPLPIINVLIFLLMLAEFAKLLSQLVLYRRTA